MSKKKHPTRLPLALVIAATVALGGFSAPTQAVIRTWDGGGANDNWSFVQALTFNTNWVGALSLPVPGDTLVFDGANRLKPNNDYTNLSINGIQFSKSAGTFVLGGQAITSTGNITNSSTNLQTINLPIRVDNGQIWDGGTGGITVNGALTLGSNALELRNRTTLNDSSSNLIVGNGFDDNASLTLTSGSQLNNNLSTIGNNALGTNLINITGAGSQWSSSTMVVGNSGIGRMTIYNAGRVNNENGYVGRIQGGSGSVLVTGANSQWNNNGNLYVGVDGVASLNIREGGQVSNSDSYVGYNGGSSGSVSINHALWTNSGNLFVGYVGTGTLDIGSDGKVDVKGGLNIGYLGKINLNGGTISADSFMRSGKGRFNWSSGTLHITGINGASLDGSNGLDAMTQLGAGQTLDVTHTLSIDSGNLLYLTGGSVKASTLALTGGAVLGGSLDMTGIGQLSGYGTVASVIIGGTAANSIQASGGNLDLGNTNSTSGFDFGGNLVVGSNQVNLLDQNQAHLGISTALSNGGRLNAANGVELGTGETLSYTGNASILGHFTNNGAVSGTGGSLTFLNDVNGAGSFAGDIVFHAAYNPGNSPAAVDFNGGNATYDASSILTMEILGNTPGAQYDQLLNIDHLTFHGLLNLVFGSGFRPSAGQGFDLFHFNSFSGSFAVDRITVSGLDRSLLDLSHLTTTGRLQISAVPLPAGVWLFASGLAALAAGSRQREWFFYSLPRT